MAQESKVCDLSKAGCCLGDIDQERAKAPKTCSKSTCLAATLTLCMLGSGPIGSQTTREAQSETYGQRNLVAIEHALKLVPFVRANSHPDVLLGLAKVFKHVSMRETVAPEIQRFALGEAGPITGSATPRVKVKKTPAHEPRDLLAEILNEARLASRGNKRILLRANALAQSSPQQTLVPIDKLDLRVGAESVVVFSLEIGGDSEIAEVLLVGNGTTNIDLLIFDDTDKMVCESSSRYGIESCVLRSLSNATYNIRILNHGPVFNDVVVLMN